VLKLETKQKVDSKQIQVLDQKVQEIVINFTSFVNFLLATHVFFTFQHVIKPKQIICFSFSQILLSPQIANYPVLNRFLNFGFFFSIALRNRVIANNHIICVWWLRTVINMKFPRRTYLFLEIELWEWKCHKHIPVLVVVNWSPIVRCITVINFDEWVWGKCLKNDPVVNTIIK
jgi:hypothetical protein